MALSRTYTSAKAADVAKLLTVEQTGGSTYPLLWSMAVPPLYCNPVIKVRD